MGTKRQETSPAPTAGDVVEDITKSAFAYAVTTDGEAAAVAEVKTPAEKPAVKQMRPAKKKVGLCVYLGPSVQGVILNGTVFSADKQATLAEMGDVLKAYPLVADLIVPGDVLPESRLKVKTPGNLLYLNYTRLAGRLKTRQGV